MNLKVITPPASSPVDLEYVKQYLRIDYDDEDALIQGMIDASVVHAEAFTRRSLAPKTYELILNDYVGQVYLPNPPLISVDSVVNEYSTPIHYEVIEERGRAVVSLSPEFDKAVITYQSGYGELPKPIEQAILLLVSHFYENRETVIVGTSVVKIPFSVESLLYPYKGWF
ncbi:head-tail connector protein [Virgibacillus dakarensis]|nr:head-tail connector protein [Virgibacillus dakarensis]MBT2215911.1 head-tail connector protein [Virgibacillus dakarensis]